MEQTTHLEMAFLNTLITEKTLVAIFLKNGIKLIGYIQEVDDSVIILQSTITILIYKDAISTIAPKQIKDSPSSPSKDKVKKVKRKVVL